MKATTFFDCFGYIADSEGGIDRLRRLILDFAMRGWLTSQDAADEPATELLQRAAEEKIRMIESKEMRRPKAYPALTEADQPYRLPDSWEWCRTVDLIHTVNGRAFKPADWSTAGLPIIRIQNLNNPSAAFNYYAGQVDDAHRIDSGDLLISWSGTPGTSFGAFVWRGPSGVLNQHIFKCYLFDDYRDYICLAINSRLDVLIDSAHGGVGLQHFTKDKLERMPLAIAPIAEQQRIVQRVAELMGLCDEFEAQQAARTKARIALTSATLHRLCRADPALELRKALATFADEMDIHLAPGDGDLEALKHLRQTILDLAVRGRLTHQDPNDTSALELIKQISLERDRLLSLKKIRKPKKFPPVGMDEVPFDLPQGWTWARANEFFITSDSGWSPQCLVEPAGPGEWGVLKTSAVSRGVFDSAENKKLPPALEPRPELKVHPGDFVMIRASGSKNLVGRGAIATETESHLMLSDKHIRLLFASEVSARFWAILNNSTEIQDYYSAESSGTSTMSNVTRDRIGALAVPVPPLAEQLRIAESVDALLSLCDRLEQQFIEARSRRRALCASISGRIAMVG